MMSLMEARNLSKERTGVVLSNKMDKTITVAAKFKEKHPIYEMCIRDSFYAALETVQNKMQNEEKSALEIWKKALDLSLIHISLIAADMPAGPVPIIAISYSA